jgi:3-methyladenine DNA glycosylase AlkD
MSELLQLRTELRTFANPERAIHSQRFFKTGKGQYGEGDIFLGLTNPQLRELTKKYLSLDFQELQELLNSKFHEERLISLLILVKKFQKAKKDPKAQYYIYNFYLNNAKKINNWDLVDLSAPKIMGGFLLRNQDQSILRQLAKSENLWEKRISIISTLTFIRDRKFGETLAIASMLLEDEHDLIHKAVGWALREIGKKNQQVLETFLLQNYKTMPRTMLRYAIEKFPEDVRQKYLRGEYETHRL